MNTMTFPNRGFRGLDHFMDAFLNDFSKESNDFMPPVNITETKDDFELVFMAPGRSKEDFKISMDKDLITVSFEQKEEKSAEEEKSVKKEFSLKSFSRSFHLDDTMDVDKVNARYENGLLTLTIPKKEEVKVLPKEIAVQ